MDIALKAMTNNDLMRHNVYWNKFYKNKEYENKIFIWIVSPICFCGRWVYERPIYQERFK